MAPTERPTPSGQIAPDLRIVESRVYRGGNIWSWRRRSTWSWISVCWRTIRPTRSTDSPIGSSSSSPRWRITAARAGSRGGFIERLREGTWLGHVAEHVAPQLQQEAGHDLRRGKTRGVKGQPGRYNVIYGYQDEGWVWLPGGWPFGSSTIWWRPPRISTSRPSWSPSCGVPSGPPSVPTLAILGEAIQPRHPLHPAEQCILRSTRQGVHAQRIRATMTSKTSALAVDIAGDKDLTAKLLGSAGLPVPEAGCRAPRPARSRSPARSGTPWSSNRSTANTAAASG